MPTKNLPKSELQICLYGGSDRLEVHENELYETSRWSLFYELVVKDNEDGKFWHTTYTCGATEIQDESPFEYEDDEIECTEVEIREVVVQEFRTVED